MSDGESDVETIGLRFTGAQLPDESHSGWKRVILGELDDQEFEFLALRILLARLSAWGKADQSPERMRECVKDLRSLFERSGGVPSARRDLERIFGGTKRK